MKKASLDEVVRNFLNSVSIQYKITYNLKLSDWTTFNNFAPWAINEHFFSSKIILEISMTVSLGKFRRKFFGLWRFLKRLTAFLKSTSSIWRILTDFMKLEFKLVAISIAFFASLTKMIL